MFIYHIALARRQRIIGLLHRLRSPGHAVSKPRKDIFPRVRSRGGVEDTRLQAKDTKKSEAKTKESPSEDRPSRGQGQEYSRPRTKDTRASALQKKGLKIFFQDKILTIQKIVLSLSRGQTSFRGLEASRLRT